MIIITQNTSEIFPQELRLCSSSSQSWRCLVFNFSKIKSKKEGWFSQVLNTVSTCLGEDGARAFLFDNEDVYFLLKFATQKAFLTLITQLSRLLSLDISSYSTLYEVPVHLEELQELINGREKNIASANLDISKESISRDEKYFSELSNSLSARRFRRIEPSILVIEDDPFSLRLVGKTLSMDYNLFTAEDGSTGFDSYLLNAPDVLFLDIGLPDANGLELMEKIFEADPSAYIVILSGNGNRENVLKAIQKGAKGFVAKPFSKEKLFTYIEKSPFIRTKLAKVY